MRGLQASDSTPQARNRPQSAPPPCQDWPARSWAAIEPELSRLLFSYEYDKPGRHHYSLK
jgi:hypothetical protein